MIYDCFLFHNELEILELKLNEQCEVVDKFVIVESCETFQGKPKRYYFEENRSRFEKFSEKIIHVKIGPQKTLKRCASRIRYALKKCGANWSREYFQRDQLKLGLVDARPGDLIIISDVDEIISAERLRYIVQNREKGKLAVFEMPLFQFSVNKAWRFQDRRLPQYRCLGPRMIDFEYFNGAQKLRKIKRVFPHWASDIPVARFLFRVIGYIKYGVFNELEYFVDTGWHFTSMGDWHFFRNKVNSFSHEDWKEIDQYKHEDIFEYFAAAPVTTYSYPFEKLPKFVQENKDMFLFR